MVMCLWTIQTLGSRGKTAQDGKRRRHFFGWFHLNSAGDTGVRNRLASGVGWGEEAGGSGWAQTATTKGNRSIEKSATPGNHEIRFGTTSLIPAIIPIDSTEPTTRALSSIEPSILH